MCKIAADDEGDEDDDDDTVLECPEGREDKARFIIAKRKMDKCFEGSDEDDEEEEDHETDEEGYAADLKCKSFLSLSLALKASLSVLCMF